MAETVKNLTEKLQSTDILRKFADGFSVIRDCNPTLWEKVICITLPFDSRKSGKFQGIDRRSKVMSMSVYGVGCFCYFVDSGFTRAYVNRTDRVCSRFLI